MFKSQEKFSINGQYLTLKIDFCAKCVKNNITATDLLTRPRTMKRFYDQDNDYGRNNGEPISKKKFEEFMQNAK